MTGQISLFHAFIYQLPNFILAALMYTALGRVLLTFFFPPDHPNYIWRFFVRITDPVINLVRYVTPHAVPHLIVVLFTVIWLFAARIALLFALASLGLVGGQG